MQEESVKDHVAVLLHVDADGFVVIKKQMVGTQSECIKWMNGNKEMIRNAVWQYEQKLIKRRIYCNSN